MQMRYIFFIAFKILIGIIFSKKNAFGVLEPSYSGRYNVSVKKQS